MRPALAFAALLSAVTPALADAADRFAITIPGPSLQAGNPNGRPQAFKHVYEQWGNGFGFVELVFPFSGLYRFTLDAAVAADRTEAAWTELRLDQQPLASGAAFGQPIADVRTGPHTWTAFVKAGRHQVAVALPARREAGRGNLLVSALRVTSDGPTRPTPEPPGRRDPWLQPFSSHSLWNTPLGADATWSAPADADTVDLRGGGGAINAGTWSMPFFLGRPDDPAALITDTDATYPIADQRLHLPRTAAPALPLEGGDHHMVVFDPDRTHVTAMFGCTRTPDGFACGQQQRDSVCDEGLGGYGWGAGVIRRWEVQAGTIRHMLRFSLPTRLTRAGDSWVSGLAWPAMRSDYNGPLGLYTGHVLYGSTVGLPPEVDIDALGLSPPGHALARALQDYGALQRDTGGSHGLILYAEAAAEGMPELDAMRRDLPRIVPHLALVRNQGPATPNGGGARRQPLLPGIDRQICPDP